MNSLITDEILLRDWNDSDFNLTVDLNRAAEEHIGMTSESGDWSQDMVGIDETFVRTGGRFILGERADQLVVMGGFKPVAESVAEVKRMRVSPELQGNGIGYWFLGLLEADMQEKGFNKATVSTTSEQEGAIRLYTGAGYAETGRAREERKHDSGIIVVSFAKNLDE